MKPMKLIGWGILVTVALIAIVFAIHNHGAQTVNFWPLPYALSAPLYAVVITALAAGFVLGAVASWVGGRGWRKLARQRRRESDALMRELDIFKAQERERTLAAPGSGSPGVAATPSRALVGKDG